MIDRDKLNELLTNTQIVLLHRIQKLSEAVKLVDGLKLSLDANSDDYLKYYIGTQLQYRKILNDQEMEWDEMERDLWDKMLKIDQPEEDQG